jgi:hypothetical protein
MIEADEFYTEPMEWYEYLPIIGLIIIGTKILWRYKW